MVGSRGGVLQKQLLTNVSGGVAVVTVVVAVVVVVVMLAVVVVVVVVAVVVVVVVVAVVVVVVMVAVVVVPRLGCTNHLVFLDPSSGQFAGIPLSFWVQRWAPYWESACTRMAICPYRSSSSRNHIPDRGRAEGVVGRMTMMMMMTMMMTMMNTCFLQ